jgi:hypothetical protein
VPAPQLTVALSSHRVEILDHCEQLLDDHDLVLLEEPADELFASMLNGELAIEEYVEELAPAFPLFARASCALWRRVHARGTPIVQLDPYQHELSQIHDFFDSGGKPDGIPSGTLRRTVYEAERAWSSVLMSWYEAASQPSFDELVAATLLFARADATRGRLRDNLRAEAVVAATNGAHRVYVEAGYLHHRLWLELRRRWPRPRDVRAVWLLEPVVRARVGRRQLLSPGDLLTLGYTFRPEKAPPRARLLAARNLVYVKISAKDESVPGGDPYPHTTEEIEAAALVDYLSYGQCEQLYAALRHLDEEQARALARRYRADAAHP